MKKIQFGYHIPVVGVRWPSGRCTNVRGSKPLTLKEVRMLLSSANIRALKKANAAGRYKEVAGVFVAPIGWTGWNAGI